MRSCIVNSYVFSCRKISLIEANILQMCIQCWILKGNVVLLNYKLVVLPCWMLYVVAIFLVSMKGCPSAWLYLGQLLCLWSTFRGYWHKFSEVLGPALLIWEILDMPVTVITYPWLPDSLLHNTPLFHYYCIRENNSILNFQFLVSSKSIIQCISVSA